MPGLLQRLGEPQQLRLHLLAIREELHVIHEQHVDILEAPPERVALPRGDGGVERLDVFVERQVFDVELPGDGLGRVPDRHQQMGFAESRATIDEERVVRRAGVLGDGLPRRYGEPVGGADDERLEGEARIQGAGHAAGLPAASFLSTSSEMPFSVSNTPVPCRARTGWCSWATARRASSTRTSRACRTCRVTCSSTAWTCGPCRSSCNTTSRISPAS